MKPRDHERYEALAAAHALGEATAAERSEFALHAWACATCAEDAAAGAQVLALLSASRDEERWQPQLDGELEARLAARRARRSQRTFAALGYAVAASLVLNVAFVGGFAGRALDALRVTPDDHYANATRIVLEQRAPRVARALPAVHRVPVGTHPAKLARRSTGPKPPAYRTGSRTAPDLAQPPVPDVFAGLALGAHSRGGDLLALDRSCAERRTGDEALPAGCAVSREFALP